VFYHVRIESRAPSRRDDATISLDKDADWIEQHIVGPHRVGERIFVSGRTFTWDEIDRITIAATPVSADRYEDTDGYWELWFRAENVTERFITGPPGQVPSAGNRPRPSFAADRKAVMVVYGHDREANTALFDWLRSVGLKPQEWGQLVHATGSASPYIGDVLVHAFEDAQAVIAFFTPDERVQARTASPESAETWRLQARPNVLIEAGMALITHPSRTVLVVLGDQELPSDLAGRHYVRLSPASTEGLNALAGRLRDAGCDIDQTGDHWLDPGRFPDRG
jgi:predicted nucleotide-binding protein